MSTPPIYSSLILPHRASLRFFLHLRARAALKATRIVLRLPVPSRVENAVTDAADMWLSEIGE